MKISFSYRIAYVYKVNQVGYRNEDIITATRLHTCTINQGNVGYRKDIIFHS